MKPKILLCIAIVLSLLQTGCATAPSVGPSATSCGGADIDKDLTKQVAAILAECQSIKPGMTRAELLKVFTTEGGLSTATHRTFVYTHCPYIKMDVDFTLSNPKQKLLEERPTDPISNLSKPYLQWSIID
ncbi:MAG: hypothetical protein ABSH08_00640 [Tepidisphaeraceae bacterium]|jgi:hypothetical protein